MVLLLAGIERQERGEIRRSGLLLTGMSVRMAVNKELKGMPRSRSKRLHCILIQKTQICA